jgi:hypothetical protein
MEFSNIARQWIFEGILLHQGKWLATQGRVSGLTGKQRQIKVALKAQGSIEQAYKRTRAPEKAL